MNYFIKVVKNIFQENPTDISKQLEPGIVTFFSQEHNSFYYIYKSGKGKCVAPSWRRGVALEKLDELSFIKQVPPYENKKIRRSDFKKIFFSLSQIQDHAEKWTQIHVDKENIFVSTIGRGQFNLEKYSINGLKKQMNDLISKMQQDLITHKRVQLGIKRALKRMLKLDPQINNLLKTISETPRSILSGDSFKLMAVLAKIFYLKSSIIALPNKFNQRKSFSKIRRILVMTNLSGQSLKDLKQQGGLWDKGISGFAWKHITGEFTRKRIEDMFENEKIQSKYDLFIYRGHGHIKNNSIYWSLKDADFPLASGLFSKYIHLACLNFHNVAEDDLKTFPFEEGILPLGFLPDNDYSELITQLLYNFKLSDNFMETSMKTLTKYQEEIMFTYCC